jgi:hypothetical protein
MNHHTAPRLSRRNFGWLGVAAGAALVMAMSCMPSAHAQPGDDAVQILKAMADYVTSQKTISLTYDSDIEVITPELQKIQFASSGQLFLSRPDKIRVTRTGGYADLELVFDGKTATLLAKNLNAFVQTEMPGPVDQLVDRLRSEFNIVAPGADLLLTSVFEDLMSDVVLPEHIGRGVIDGIECEHLAFRALETDWQIWIEVGARPIPHKYVITSKSVTAAPQYTLRIKDWGTDVQANAGTFDFKPPQGASKVAMEALRDLDEVPPGVITGGTK